ncbi:MAG TPA: penicillin-binding protein 2 [Candidatus Limnocylindrales bacterium]|nr:penicillin-binding protein 2 [Candidatus Limnocylindrales bacterium]
MGRLPWRRPGRGRKGPARVAASLPRLSLALALGYSALAGGLVYWQVFQANELTTDPGNPLVIAASRQALRGTIYDRNGIVLAHNAAGGRREYPYLAAAPVVGYRSTLFGTAGLERTYDAALTGLVSRRPGDELLRKFRDTPYNPSDVYTSLDINLQQVAADLLANERGAIVAIEPSTGRILALVSSPTYNPNRITDPDTARSYMADITVREDSPLLNRASQGLYVPGSVFKIVTAIAGIGSGAVNGSTTFEDQPAEYESGFLVEGFRIHDFPRRVQLDHPLDFYEATEISSNIWYAHAGLEIGAGTLDEFAARLGFGQRVPFELPTSPSQITGGEGPQDSFRDQVELANAAYGQGEVLVTPLQMALVASTIANDGLLMRPKLVDELRAEDGTVSTLSPDAMSQVLGFSEAQVIGEAMRGAVEGPFGENLAGAAKVPGIPTAGKSGTAELGDDAAPHSWFIGYAPADNPQIAIAVIVEGGGAGSQRAVPMGGDILAAFLLGGE